MADNQIWIVMETMQTGSLPRLLLHAIYSNEGAALEHIQLAKKMDSRAKLEVQRWEVHEKPLTAM